MMMIGTTTIGTTTTGTTDPVAAAPRAGKMATMSQAPSTSRWSRILPSAARTRIIAWVLLLVMAALGIVTLATWLLLKSSINARMDEALRVEVEEFGELSAPGVNPRTGEPFASIDEVIHEAIAYNIARPNEKFLGYVDGVYRTQSRQEPGATEVLAQDEVFGRRVATVTEPTAGLYEHPSAGEVRYLAIPVSLDGDDSRGVIVAAYLGDAEREAADNAARMLLLVGSVTMVGAAAGAWLLAGRVLHPLRDVVATAHTITDTDMSQRIPMRRGGERDEINELVATLNGMLDRIEAGIAVQRRFIDDVGHELRTPITIVRGHLEVLDPTDAEDIAATVALVDDELTRMNRMVSDLLVLAHSEQPSFLQPEHTDVAVLTEDAFIKVSRLAERNFVLETTADVTAVLDPQRITQALVALADNATRFTAPGARIGVGSQLSGGWLRFWVSDSGPGVSPADQARIFDRFARGNGRHSGDGAGLGLSIVRAIAVAHGGDVLLDSVQGRGATFSITIPAVLEDRWPAS